MTCVRVLLGTTNPSKVRRFQALLAGYPVEFLTLRDLGIIEEPQETGADPEENARIKAAFYGRYFDRVVCNDSGLYFGGLPLGDPRQPGLHVRSPRGRYLDDEAMIVYYRQLAQELGGKVLACYLNGLAVFCKGRIFSYLESGPEAWQEAFYLVDRPSPLRHPGWPLDSLSLDRHTGRYFVEPEDGRKDAGAQQGRQEDYRRRYAGFLAQALGLEPR